jgi:hypothetical protein
MRYSIFMRSTFEDDGVRYQVVMRLMPQVILWERFVQWERSIRGFIGGPEFRQATRDQEDACRYYMAQHDPRTAPPWQRRKVAGRVEPPPPQKEASGA